jgi:hypothetical protein
VKFTIFCFSRDRSGTPFLEKSLFIFLPEKSDSSFYGLKNGF